MQKIEVRKDRPDVPEGWRVFNAPRPLYGHVRWQGEFITGIFYAAVDPSEPNAEAHIDRNDSLDAREIVYLTEQEFDERVDAYCQALAEEYGIDLADFDRREMIHSYQDHMRQQGEDVRW